MFSKLIFTAAFFVALTAASPIQEVEASSAAPGNCPPDFFQAYSTFQCFQIFNDSKIFIDAELYCNGLGGHLASIHSGFDNMLITGKARSIIGENSTLFTGGNNLQSQNTWQWVDMESMDYTDFDFPMESDPYKNCLQIFTDHGKWKAGDCYTAASFVCEVYRS
ncbi:hypothetical protein FO519_004069 [Halicephalobus sp. NKZ332]|nr:hypothetical protein FO519_004069 [Halicephalobus sp. NKZ332]